MATKRQDEYKASNGASYVPGVGFVKKNNTSKSSTTSSAVNAGPQPATTSSGVNKKIMGLSDYLQNASSSSGSSSSTSKNTNKNTYVAPTLGGTYDKNTDYQTIINNAVANGDYMTAAKAEQLRNQKIIAEGMNYDRTNTYGGYLDGSGIDYSIIGQNQMNSGASKEDVETTYLARLAKIIGNDNLSQYADDDVQRAMYEYIYGNIKDENQVEEFEWDEDMPTYDSKWTPEMEELLYAILNRDDFSYDALNDPLYQQYAEQYRREGDRARTETLADVAAGAGGMNSYAVTAASQAQNYYNSQLADKIPELYQLAYQMYINDKEGMVQDLGLLQGMDATAYNRYRDTVNDYYNDRNFAYQMYLDDVAQGNWNAEFDYNAFLNQQNSVTNNAWAQKEYNANQTQQNLENKWYEDSVAKEDAQQALENERYDREQAIEEVQYYIALGVVPNSELIKKAGMDEYEVLRAVEEKKADRKIEQSSVKVETPVSELGTIEQLTRGGQQILASQGAEAVDSYLKEAMSYGIIDQNTYLVLYKQICG